MPALLHPGVYVLEVSSGVRTIEGVPTSTTIFVGETERGPAWAKIKGRSEYERVFGGFLRHAVDPGASSTGVVADRRVLMAYAMDAFYRNGGSTAYIYRAVADVPDGGGTTGDLLDTAYETTPAQGTTGWAQREVTVEGGGGAAPGFWIEAVGAGVWGNDIYVVVFRSSDEPTTPPADRQHFRLGIYYRNLEKGRFELVESWDRLSVTPGDEGYVRDVLQRSNYVRWRQLDDDAALTAPLEVEFDFSDAGDNPNGYKTPAQLGDDDLDALAGSRLVDGAGGIAPLTPAQYDALLSRTDGVDDAALLVCASDLWVNPTPPAGYEAALFSTFRSYADLRPKRDLFFVGDLQRQGNQETTTAVASVATLVREGTWAASNMAGVFWPHVRVADPVGAGRNPSIVVPPAGFAAGIFARTDGRRGVWKAPAGTEAVLNGIVSLDYPLLDTHQDDINILGINALRRIPSAGPVIWGSRTLEPTSEWRYVPVRRTAMFLRKSIYNGIQWAVFEPNDQDLWQSLRATIGAFMETQFRNGAFAGATAREAYFVKCDGETTTELDQANGVVNILVGFAPLRPAEFVVVQLSQKTSLTA